MNNSEESAPQPAPGRTTSAFPTLTIATSLAAIAATYLLASSTVELGTKTKGFSIIIATFLAACALFFFRQVRVIAAADEIGYESGLDHHLSSLDEAREYFAGALNGPDTFRFVASRIKAITPFTSACLLLLDKSRIQFSVCEVLGFGGVDQKGETRPIGSGLAGKCFADRAIGVGSEAFHYLEPAVPSVAIPLLRDQEAFGVLQLYFDGAFDTSNIETTTLEAIATRVAPLILSSIAFERSKENALTDVTTDLPNERAFYLILENQLAEALRKRIDRPLTILTMDVKGFNDINRRYGHAVGDTVLQHVAMTIKDNLRQMDFFARSLNDEFLAILPTASKEISPDVIARIHTGFFGRRLKVTDTESIELELNFGWAAFGDDGETANQLLEVARLRKSQSKFGTSMRVLSFSKQVST